MLFYPLMIRKVDDIVGENFLYLENLLIWLSYMTWGSGVLLSHGKEMVFLKG